MSPNPNAHAHLTQRAAIVTIGHSTLARPDMEELLAVAGVDHLLDVRSHPTSHLTQYRRASMVRWARPWGYRWMPALGGWRANHADDPALVIPMSNHGVDVAAYAGAFPKGRISTPTPPRLRSWQAWSNLGFYDYSWFMATDEFLRGAEALIEAARETRGTYALMCAELLWWQCHRAMIADYLVWRGLKVVHLQPRRQAHRARVERYHPDIVAAWRRWRADHE